MKYRDRTTGQIYSLFELQQKFSHVSFPTVWSVDTYNFANVDPIVETPSISTHPYNRPECSVELVNGMWTEVWREVPKYDNPEEQTAWVKEYDEMEKQSVLEAYPLYVASAREERNKRLAETDYTQLPDAPITSTCKEEFKVYRQALRNIDFQNPFDIVWPTVPTYVKE